MFLVGYLVEVGPYHCYQGKGYVVLGPVYTTVKKCTGKSYYMFIWGKGWYAGGDEKTIKYFIQVGVFWRSSLLSEALRLSKKLDLRRTSLLESVRHVGIDVIIVIHVQCSPPPDSWP